MKLDFTEFSFGYAFTENLIRSSSSWPAVAPVFPNLIQEGRFGYDVRIDLPAVPVFFQFKLPELMVRNSAREITQFGLRNISIPFFRMSLMRRNMSDQHLHLTRLEKRFPNSVFYASPLFENTDAFNCAYSFAEVHLHSALFSPQDIGPLPDDKSHGVAYSSSTRVAWMCSEPRQIKLRSFADLAEQINDDLAERSGISLEESVQKVKQDVWPLLPEVLRNAEPDIRNSQGENLRTKSRQDDLDEQRFTTTTNLLMIRDLVRVGMGVELLIAQPGEDRMARQ